MLIAALEEELVAFDANSGEQLWTSQDKDVRGAFAGYENPVDDGPDPPSPRYLAQSTGLFMMEFDPRTGTENWRHSMGCSRTAYTPAEMVCLNVGPAHVAAAVVDSATGARRPDVDVPIPGAGRPETSPGLYNVVASDQGLALMLSLPTLGVRDTPPQAVYLNTRTGASVPLGDDVSTVIGDDPLGDLLVGRQDEYYRPMTAALHDSAGAQRCVFGPDADLSEAEFEVTAWLDDQIVAVVDRGGEFDPESALVVFDRDCRVLPAPSVPAGTEVTSIVPAPGATLLVRSDENGTHVDGYAPAP